MGMVAAKNTFIGVTIQKSGNERYIYLFNAVIVSSFQLKIIENHVTKTGSNAYFHGSSSDI